MRRTWPRPEMLVGEPQPPSIPSINVRRAVLVSGQGLALGAVPTLLAVACPVLLVAGWDWGLFAVWLLGVIVAVATGFPFAVFCGRRGIWRLSGLVSWTRIRGVGLARTYNIATDGYEEGNLVPVLAVTSGSGMKWMVLRELRTRGSERGRRRSTHVVSALLQGGSHPMQLPASVQPWLL